MAKTVVGSFDSYSQAQTVVEELVSIGIVRDEISIVGNEAWQEHATNGTASGEAASGAGKGAS